MTLAERLQARLKDELGLDVEISYRLGCKQYTDFMRLKWAAKCSDFSEDIGSYLTISEALKANKLKVVNYLDRITNIEAV